MAEILLYNAIYDFTAADFIKELDANKGNDICIRVNCPGGDVYSGYGMIAKFGEHKGSKTVKVDGRAASGAFYFCVAADDVECLDVSEFMVHRAAFPSWIENNPERFTEEMKASLKTTNDNLRALMESKVSSRIFKNKTGVSYDELFSLDKRIDVNLTAKQMKELDIVTKINPLTDKMKKEVIALSAQYGVAAFSNQVFLNKNDKKMTSSEIKNQFSEVYNEIIALGIKNERERVETFIPFIEVDKDTVLKALKEGTEFSSKHMSEFTEKTINHRLAQKVADTAPKDVAATTPPNETAKTAEQQKNEILAKELEKHLGITDYVGKSVNVTKKFE